MGWLVSGPPGSGGHGHPRDVRAGVAPRPRPGRDPRARRLHPRRQPRPRQPPGCCSHLWTTLQLCNSISTAEHHWLNIQGGARMNSPPCRGQAGPCGRRAATSRTASCRAAAPRAGRSPSTGSTPVSRRRGRGCGPTFRALGWGGADPIFLLESEPENSERTGGFGRIVVLPHRSLTFICQIY